MIEYFSPIYILIILLNILSLLLWYLSFYHYVYKRPKNSIDIMRQAFCDAEKLNELKNLHSLMEICRGPEVDDETLMLTSDLERIKSVFITSTQAEKIGLSAFWYYNKVRDSNMRIMMYKDSDSEFAKSLWRVIKIYNEYFGQNED